MEPQPIQVLVSLRDAVANSNIEPNTTTTSIARPRMFPIPGLNELVQKHFRDTTRNGGTPQPLGITGRYHELLYLLVATLISPPWEKTISIVDFDGRFDAIRLLVTRPVGTDTPDKVGREDLEHVYVWRPGKGYEGDVCAEVEKFMMYGDHGSRRREWWGAVVIGAPGNITGKSNAHVVVTAGRKGWLRVERAQIQGFGGKGVEQALSERESRQAAVAAAGWVGSSLWGDFMFGGY